MNKWLEILIGLIILNGIILISWMSSSQAWTVFGKNLNFLHAGWLFLQGGIFWILVMIGLLFIVLGISDLKE
jgi:hypothetical protein